MDTCIAFLAQASSGGQVSGGMAAGAEQGAQSTGLMLQQVTSEEGECRGERSVPGTSLALGFLDLFGNEETGERSRESLLGPVVYEKTGGQNGHKNSLSESDITLNAGSATWQRPLERVPYQCSTCDRSFMHYSYVMKHQIIYSGGKPCEWSGCERAFIHSSHVIRHQ